MQDLLLELQTPAFWIGLLQIIGIDIVLSGDNAVVIALAARRLPPPQRRVAVITGAGAAIVLRVVLTLFAALLLELPWVKTIGGLLLLWIAVKLVAPDDDGHSGEVEAAGNFWQAVRVILVADFIMSLDNVIGIAAAAKGSVTLLVLGLLISIPLIIFSSTLLLKWMERLPIIITAGGALLGWIGATTIISDPAWTAGAPVDPLLRVGAGLFGVALVLLSGRMLKARRERRPQMKEL